MGAGDDRANDTDIDCNCGDADCPECGRPCWECGGDGYSESAQSGWLWWPEGRVVACRNCGGSGLLRDCWYW